MQGRAVRQAEPHFFLCLLIQEKFKHLNDIWTFIVNPKCNKNTFATFCMLRMSHKISSWSVPTFILPIL